MAHCGNHGDDDSVTMAHGDDDGGTTYDGPCGATYVMNAILSTDAYN